MEADLGFTSVEGIDVPACIDERAPVLGILVLLLQYIRKRYSQTFIVICVNILRSVAKEK